MMEGTTEVPHPIAAAHFPEAASVFDAAPALDTAMDRVAPQPTMVERLVHHVLLPRELLPQIEINSIDVPGALQTQAYKINDRGQIVGLFIDAGGAQHGFLWEDGVFITIDVPGALATAALDIDNHGRIVGQYLESGFVGAYPAGRSWDVRPWEGRATRHES
jgi:probable HAF family extracellular repeat protein